MVQTRRYSILVADDNETYRRDLKSILDGEGHFTYLADCGVRAIEILFSEKIHLSILEMNLPDIPGLEVVGLLNRKKKQVPFLFLAADNSKEMQIQALNAGAETVLLKPLDSGIIAVTVNHILEKLFEGRSRLFPCS